MQGNFSYHNPTKLYFGDESLNYLKDELTHFGPIVLLNYGSGSVKRNGIYDQVVAILKEAGKTIVENPGVMSNPTVENWMLEIGLPLTISELMEQREQSQTALNSAERQKKTEGQIGATPDMIPGITEGTICYPAGYMDLKPEDITEILKDSL
jgi:alcohol dehydrogenase YqhD (iron-dependent ADH family)